MLILSKNGNSGWCQVIEISLTDSKLSCSQPRKCLFAMNCTFPITHSFPFFLALISCIAALVVSLILFFCILGAAYELYAIDCAFSFLFLKFSDLFSSADDNCFFFPGSVQSVTCPLLIVPVTIFSWLPCLTGLRSWTPHYYSQVRHNTLVS